MKFKKNLYYLFNFQFLQIINTNKFKNFNNFKYNNNILEYNNNFFNNICLLNLYSKKNLIHFNSFINDL